MKARDIFGISLRTAALYLCFYGAWYTLAGIKQIPATIFNELTGANDQHTSWGWFTYGIPALIVGLCILRFAEGLMRFTYRPETPPPLPNADRQPVKVGDDL